MEARSVSITVIGGYLGAGKTTLLNHLLHQVGTERLGVIVNDFGSINIDAELVVGVDGDLVELSNGCICCSMRDDLVEALRRLLDTPDPPTRVLVEASGVSDPRTVAATIDRGPSRDWATLDAIVVVVDAQRHLGLSRRERIVEGGQIVAADLLVLNKVDGLDGQALATVDGRVRRQSRSGRVVHAVHGQVPSEVVLGIAAFDSARLDEASPMDVHVHEADAGHSHSHEHAHAHGQDFWTWSFRSARPLSARRLRKVIRDLPKSIVRAKGTIKLGSHLDERAILHVVGRRAELSLAGPWPTEAAETTIVFIGIGDPPPTEPLREALAGCEVEPGEGGTAGAVMRWVRKVLPGA